MKLRPSDVSAIKSKSAAMSEPIRLAVCRCGWRLAARSGAELVTEGWRSVVGPTKFICATCAAEDDARPATMVELLPAGAIPFVGGDEKPLSVDVAFLTLERCADDAFPRVGGRGERHFQTSRPTDVKPMGGV